jgi:hypothetical protein
MLREPVDRVISHYHFVRHDPTHYLYDSAQSMSLEQFVIACDGHEPNNDQTRLLAGISDDSVGERLGEEQLLARAVLHVRERIALTGLTEDFDRSVLLMKHAFGWRSPFYMKLNVSKSRPADLVSPQTLAVIRHYNRLDLELYRCARDVLAEQIRPNAPWLERERRTFQRLNYVYGNVYMPVRSRVAMAGAAAP